MEEPKAPVLQTEAQRGGMLMSAASLYGYNIRATDGEIGKVHEFYFDDESWAIRYFVIDTGTWLRDRKVLISPVTIGKPDYQKKVFPVTISKEQMRNSPEADERKPVSRQHEMDLAAYYGWPMHWTYGGFYNIAPPPPGYETERELKYEEEENDPHLRSTREVAGYHIQAADGEIGHVDDFIVDDGNWSIRYVVVDTRNWLPGRKVLLAPQWISEISWDERKVYTDLLMEEIKNSPEFDPSAPVSKEYEERLYDYYGRSKYWE